MKVIIEKCERYEDVEKAIEEGLKKIGGIEKFVKKDEKVAIKLNLLQARKPEEAITTHPEIVRAVVRQLKKVTKDITLIDSPGIAGNVQGWKRIIKKTGMEEIAKSEGIKIEMLQKQKEVKSDKWIITRNIIISEEIYNYDKIVNIAKLKTHSLTVYTGAVKNMFGVIPGILKAGMHMKYQSPENFSKMLLDLYMVKKPDLNIIDGVDGMEGDGPSAGDKKHFGIIGISQDALALDYAITKGFKINVPMIKIAEERGMIKEVEVEGKIEGNIKLPKSSLLDSMLVPVAGNIRKIISPKPALNQEKCTRCASCFKICPADAIKMKPYPEFDYDKCIRCYCCHEICPERAIYLKKSIAQKLLRR